MIYFNEINKMIENNNNNNTSYNKGENENENITIFEKSLNWTIEIYRQKMFNILLWEINQKQEILTRFAPWEWCKIGNLWDFFEYIEKNNKTYMYDFYILERVIQWLSNKTIQRISAVNLYPSTIYNNDFKKDLIELIEKYHIESQTEMLILEIIEKENYLNDWKDKIRKIQDNINYFKRNYGICFSIDDYPEEWNNFYFIEMIKDIDFIKIDWMYFAELYNNSDDFDAEFQSLLDTIYDIHQSIQIVVEMIENKEMFETILNYKWIIYSQGYYHHKPEKIE